MNRVYAICFALFFLFPVSAKCQYYFYDDTYYDSDICWEAGLSTGGVNCLTDLGGKSGPGKRFIKDINWNNSRMCGGLYGALTYRNFLAARLELFLGEINAADSVLKNDGSASYGRYLRNLHFRTDIVETSVLFEFHPLQLSHNLKDKGPSVVSPFITAGIGLFSFNPQARFNNAWINLSVLHTEGQGLAQYPGRNAYRLRQSNIPIGAGIRYQASAILTIRLELVYRKLWTDYLDDVSKTYSDPANFNRHSSQTFAHLATRLADRRLISSSVYEAGDIRGNPKNKDAYFSGMVKIGVTLGRQKRM